MWCWGRIFACFVTNDTSLYIEATGPWTSWLICSVVAMVPVSWAQTRPRLTPLLMCGYSCVACTVSAQPAPALGRELQCSCCYPARAVAHSFYPDHSSGGVLGVATTIAIAVKCSSAPQLPRRPNSGSATWSHFRVADRGCKFRWHFGDLTDRRDM